VATVISDDPASSIFRVKVDIEAADSFEMFVTSY
jgi:hypothetical protein